MSLSFPWYAKLVAGVALAAGPIAVLYNNPYIIWKLKDEKSGIRPKKYLSEISDFKKRESSSGLARIYSDEEVQESGLTIVGAKYVRRA